MGRNQAQTIGSNKLSNGQELFFKFKGTPSQQVHKTVSASSQQLNRLCLNDSVAESKLFFGSGSDLSERFGSSPAPALYAIRYFMSQNLHTPTSCCGRPYHLGEKI
jgi:hypothetical protein